MACLTGQYCAGGVAAPEPCSPETWDHDQDAATGCVPKTRCVPGEHVASSGSSTEDRVCSPCAAEMFSIRENVGACSAWSSCEPGSFVSAIGTSVADRACAACPAGTYASAVNQFACLPHDPCPAGMDQTEPGTARSNPVCTPQPGLSIGGTVAISVGISRPLKLLQDTGGTLEDRTAQASWASSDPGVATVSSGGSVIGVNPGTVVISATLGIHTVSKSFAVVSGGSLSASFNQGNPLTVPFADGAGTDRGMGVVLTPQRELVVLVDLAGDIGLLKLDLSGQLVTSFGNQGKVRFDLGAYEYAHSLVRHNNGYLFAGFKGPNSSGGDGLIVRVNEDGSLDTSFGSNGVLTVDAGGAKDRFYGVRVGADGMTYAAGSRDDGAAGFLVKVSAQGVLDPSFHNDGIVIGSQTGEFAYATAIADGSVIVSAYAPSWPPNPAIVKYLPNGSPDSSFGVNGFSSRSLSTSDDKVRSLLVDNHGRYLSGGWHSNVLGASTNYDACVIRWLPTGSVDASFGTSGYVCVPLGGPTGNEYTRALLDGGDDTILVVGSGTSSGSSSVNNAAVARLLPGGTLDQAFGASGVWKLSGAAVSNQLLGGVRDAETGIAYFVGSVANSSLTTGTDVLVVALNP